MAESQVRVLLDGRNLALPEGTGIKTYGLTLLQALQRLGMEADILASAQTSGDPLVARALLVESVHQPVRWSNPLSEIGRKLFQRDRVADYVPPWKVEDYPVSPEVFPFGHGCSVIPHIYDQAFAAHEQLGQITRFRTKRAYQVFHATRPLPLGPVDMALITTLHDLIPLVQPHTCPAHRAAHAAETRWALNKSRALATVSEYTKQDVLKHFPADADKIHVTYQPTLLENWRAEPALQVGVLRNFKLLPQKYLLFVGNIEPKKNLGRLIRAYLSLDCDLPLVVVGRKAWMWKEDLASIGDLGKGPDARIRLLGYVHQEWMPYLMASAYALVFPSLYEGFGLPALEAMTLGCPVICSRTASLPEVCGEAAEYVEPTDTESIRTGLERVLRDAAYRDQLAVRGRERAKLFSMENYLIKVKSLYEKALA